MKKQTTILLTEYREASADVWRWFKSNLDFDWDKILESGDELIEKYQGKAVEGYVMEYVVILTQEIAKIEKRLG